MFDYTFQWGVAFSHLPYLLGGAWVTLHLTFIGFWLGMVIGVFAAVGQQLGGPVLRRGIDAYVIFFTNTPSLVTAFFIFYGLPEFGIVLSPYLSILLNLVLNAGAFLADVIRGGVASAKNYPDVNWVILESIIKTSYCALGVKKGNYSLRDFLNAALYEIQSADIHNQIWEKHWGRPPLVKVVAQPYW